MIFAGAAILIKPSFNVVANVNMQAPSSPMDMRTAALTDNITQQSVLTPRSQPAKYNTFFGASKVGPVIPGLAQDLIPQGITYDSTQDWFLISSYRKGKAAMITVVDAVTGTFVKSMSIYNSDGTPYLGHAGGIAVTPTDVWVVSGAFVNRIPLQSIQEMDFNNRVYIEDRFRTGVRSSFTTYANGILWIGEHHNYSRSVTDVSHYKVTRAGTTNHAWMMGFALDATGRLPSGTKNDDSTAVTPDYIVSIPDKLQGAAILYDKSIVLSRSYGRTVDSRLLFFEDVLSQSPHYYSTVNGITVPSWFLDRFSLKANVIAPPLAEGVVERKHTLTVLFESGAAAYRSTTTYPIDRLYHVDWSNFY
jgi:hypothetical protein